MKASITRVLCLALVAMMAIAVFAGCTQQPKDTTPTDVSTVTETTPESVPEPIIVGPEDDDPYTISKDADGKDVVILTPNDDGTATMNVAEGTTLEQFFTLVTAKEGYTQKVTDAEGNEVTDMAAVIVDGMTYAVYADGEADPAKQFAIHVESQEKIEETVSQAAVVSEQIAKAEEGKKSSGKGNGNKGSGKGNGNSNGKDPGSTTSPGSTPPSGTSPGKPGKPTVKTIDITLGTIYGTVYNSSDAAGKEWTSHFENMKNKYHIATTIDVIDVSSAADTIIKEVMAGKSSADVFDISQVMCRNVAKKKAAANIYASKTLKQSLYNTGATASETFGGKVYGVAFASKSTQPMGVIYNKDMVKKYAPDYDIAKLYNDGKWTFDAFRSIAKLCTRDTNGDIKTDVFGFTSNTNIIGMALTSNAGGTALMKNGRVEATMCNDEGVHALEWCKALWKDDKSWNYKADIMQCVNAFANGEAAMFVSYLMYYPYIAAQANFSFGFVLMPIGPDQTEYKNGIYDCSLFVVPKTKEGRLDDIGNWLNYVAAISSKLINHKVTDLARNGFDITSQNVYKWAVNHMTAEFGSGPFSASTSQAIDSSVTSPSKSPAKVCASIKSQAQAECDDYYGELY